MTACYLARAGWKVLVLERRYVVGGACVTEEVFPGFKVSTAAYVNSLFRKEIIRDLRLAELRLRRRWNATRRRSRPFPMAAICCSAPTAELNLARDRQVQHAATPRTIRKYEAMLERVADVIEPTLLMTPPNVLQPGPGATCGSCSSSAGRSRRWAPGMSEAVEILTGPARPILDRWFESEQLKATLATDAIIGAFAAPSMPGTAYVLFHHVMGETNGKRGVWAYVRGGMGGLTQALANAAKDLGVEIRTEAEVATILVQDGTATGVALANGDEFRRRVVASNADANVTFDKLLDPQLLPPDFRRRDQAHRLRQRLAEDQRRPVANCRTSPPARHAARPAASRHHPHLPRPGLHRTRLRRRQIWPAVASSPILECTMPSAVDPTVAPPGQHLMSMFIQYAPYKLRGRQLGRAARRRSPTAASTCSNEYAPNFKRSVIARQVLIAARPGAHLQPDGRQHLPGRDDAEPAVLLPPGAGLRRTIARRSRACTCAARPRIPAAASWATAAGTRRGNVGKMKWRNQVETPLTSWPICLVFFQSKKWMPPSSAMNPAARLLLARLLPGGPR